MRSKLFVLASALVLASCAGMNFVPVKTDYKLIKPDQAYLQCDIVSSFPDPTTLKDTEVADLLNHMYKDNMVCKNNMDALKQFYSAADQIFKDTNKAPKQ